MTDNIRRIKQIDAEIAKLQKILSKSEHVGAGLSISLHVGALNDEHEIDLPNLQLTHDTEPLLLLMVESLKKSRACTEAMARQELRELQAHFGEQPK